MLALIIKAAVREVGAMKSSERRRALVQRVRDEGYVDAAALADQFGVDSSTIRRDLAQLTRSGLIRRTHGGVLPTDPGAVIDTPYEVRQSENLAAKQAIARVAADLVEDGQIIILDNGSTTYQIANELRRRRNLTIITNDLLIGICTAGHPSNRLHMTGGVLLDTVYTLVGPRAVDAFEGLHADWAFLGAEAIDATAGVTNINVVEIPIKHAMMAAAARSVFAVDSSKFGRRAFATVCQLDAVDLILTDSGLAPDMRPPFGTKLRCA
jgi:DeoR family transcriptional regulator, aga operon transcriptional repressor